MPSSSLAATREVSACHFLAKATFVHQRNTGSWISLWGVLVGMKRGVCWGQPKQPCQGNAERRWQRSEHTLAFCREISGRTGSSALCTAISALVLTPGSLHLHHHIKQTQALCPSPSACETHFNPFLPLFFVHY